MASVFKDVVQVLDQARKTLSKEEYWTTNNEAVDADGNDVNVNSKDAVKWCLVGAIEKAKGSDNAKLGARQIILTAIEQRPFKYTSDDDTEAERIGEWNDAAKRKYADVSAILAKSCKLARCHADILNGSAVPMKKKKSKKK